MAGSTPTWIVLTVIAGGLIWLFLPSSLAPSVLRHGESARNFLDSLWQVVAVALALSAAIVTFSFATFTSSRLSELGASLPGFARSSGLLVGITVGLVALLGCGASLLALPAEVTSGSYLSRSASAGAMAATVLSVLALAFIPYVMRRALRAGDRGWVQRTLGERIQRTLEHTVEAYVENTYARGILEDAMHRSGLETAPLEGPAGYHPLKHQRTGTIIDIRLRLLVRLADEGATAIRLNPLLATTAIGFETVRGAPCLWVRDGLEISDWDARRVIRTRQKTSEPTSATDIDRLNRQALLAIREDDDTWYREVAHIYRAVPLHLIAAWALFGASPGRIPGQDDVGLRRLGEDIAAHVSEIMDLKRDEMAPQAVEVPLSVALEALEHRDDGVGLALKMALLLGEITIDATRRGPENTAMIARRHAAGAFFTILQTAATDL